VSPITDRREYSVSIVEHESAPGVLMLPGIFRRTMTDGERMMLCEVHLAEGAVLASHTHPHEQTGYLISGRMSLKIGDERRGVGPGDAWLVPPDVPHEARALEATLVIEVFSPPRDDFR
jgi:quercetin dioxygenase-like cupin family protein